MKKSDTTKSLQDVTDPSPSDCPFREFRDNELSPEYWGLGPTAFRSAFRLGKGGLKTQGDQAWVDDQIQPLPRSTRRLFHSWVRAEELAKTLWDTEVAIFEDSINGLMSSVEIQFSHCRVLQMSSFCRRVLSMCYVLERAEDFTVQHQWDLFMFNMPPEGWRARYHIYSPGLKHGGGQQHRPTLSKNGCYLVRLYYIGAWRCVWVTDEVPVDAKETPLLPFAPSFYQNSARPSGKQAAPIISSPSVLLWPLLICKALLKLAAPGMDSDCDNHNGEDEAFNDLDIFHALTGALTLTLSIDGDQLWNRIISEVPKFSWDDDDETITSTVKTKAKKSSNKEISVFKHRSLTSVLIRDTKDTPPFALPGITPAYDMELLIVMTRDLPLKKPLPEPEVAQWKHLRWIEWARKHGLYEAYDCPRMRFLKMNGLLKLSLAPQLLDVQSTDSINFCFREEHGKSNPTVKKSKVENRSTTTNQTNTQQTKEEQREWIQFEAIQKFMKSVSFHYYPSMYQFCSIASNPSSRVNKLPSNKELDVPALKTAPLYLQIDGPGENVLRISCSMDHPRVFLQAGLPIGDYVEPGYVLIERFEWFDECELPRPTSYLQTRGYCATEVTFPPGRHFCRLWTHSRVPWHVMLLSDSTIHVGTCDVIQVAAVKECPWTSKFLNAIGTAFQNFIRPNKSNSLIAYQDRDFYKSYQPDLQWDSKLVGYRKSNLHWMFRQALQSLLNKKLTPFDYKLTCKTMQQYFYDPEFGLCKKTASFVLPKDCVVDDPCSCPQPDTEEFELLGTQYDLTSTKDKSRNNAFPPNNLLPRVCEAATEMPCGALKISRDIIISRHEAATRIQAYWRGTRARKCVETRATVTPEVMKCLMDSAFGNVEALSALVNEFFTMFPGTKTAYSVASGIAGSYGLKQYNGVTNITPQSVWIPLFQGVFYCHAPVKVHLDCKSTVTENKMNSTVEVYDNDTKERLPYAYTTSIALKLSPNTDGYTVIGHAMLKQVTNTSSEIQWQLSVLTSIANTIHVCSNELDGCRELPLPSSVRLHIDEIFIPNERNVIGGIQISISRRESICFRAAASSDDLEMIAILQTTTSDGETKEIQSRTGKGELYWPYIRLEPPSPGLNVKSMSQADVNTQHSETTITPVRSQRSVREGKPLSAGLKVRSTVKVKDQRVAPELITYTIEVRVPKGWALTLSQWKRVIEIQNNQDSKIGRSRSKKSFKDKVVFTKNKDKVEVLSSHQVHPGDAYVQLECSLCGDTGSVMKRDDTRDLRFAAAVRSWEANEPGRNSKGAFIRQEFRDEYFQAVTNNVQIPDAISIEMTLIPETPECQSEYLNDRHGPTLASESVVSDAHKNLGGVKPEAEFINEIKYLLVPEELKDKFKPLHFVPSSTREKTKDECIIMTSEIAEAAKSNRKADIEAAYDRMKQLQEYYDVQILGGQKTRCDLLETLLVDSQWGPSLTEALEARDNTLVSEVLKKSVSGIRKKQETKAK